MPLFEYECIPCRNNVENAINELEKKVTKKMVTGLVRKAKNINHIGVLDLEKEEVIAEHGKRDTDGVDLNYYLNEGTLLVFFNHPKNFRFSELIYVKKDEKKLKCPFCETKEVEKVVSSFAFTSDLSTNMPKPDLSNLPLELRNKTFIGDYIEEKDRPKKNR